MWSFVGSGRCRRRWLGYKRAVVKGLWDTVGCGEGWRGVERVLAG